MRIRIQWSGPKKKIFLKHCYHKVNSGLPEPPFFDISTPTCPLRPPQSSSLSFTSSTSLSSYYYDSASSSSYSYYYSSASSPSYSYSSSLTSSFFSSSFPSLSSYSYLSSYSSYSYYYSFFLLLVHVLLHPDPLH